MSKRRTGSHGKRQAKRAEHARDIRKAKRTGRADKLKHVISNIRRRIMDEKGTQ
jgi:hypothetical protein